MNRLPSLPAPPVRPPVRLPVPARRWSVAALALAMALPLPALAADEVAPAAEAPAPVAPAPAPAPAPNPTNGQRPTPPADARLTFEFRGARLSQVLDYLSKEAGFVIINPIELPNPITLVARQPLTPAEAVDALQTVLLEQGYAAIVRGRTLRVVPQAQARQMNLPVEVGADPGKIGETDRIVTQVIPVRFAVAKDLADNLLPLLQPGLASLSANESSNTLILTDTEANVRRIASIVHAIDSSISGEQQVKVVMLAHANADQVAKVINEIYGERGGSSSRGGGGNDVFRQFQFGGGGGGGGRGGGGGGNNQSGGSQAATHGESVAAAADPGTNSVVLRASPSTLALLEKMVREMDVDTTAREGVLVYQVRNGKAVDMAKTLTTLFSGSSGSSSGGGTNQQNRTPGGGATGATGGTGGAAATSGRSIGGGALTSEDGDLNGQVRVVADETSNHVLLLSQERNFDRLRSILASLDAALPQVLVRVLVAEVTLEDGRELGVELDGIDLRTNTTESRVFTDFGLFDTSTLGLNGFLLESDRFRAAIRALDSTNRLDILSRPYVLTADNREAEVNVSQEVPIITSTRTNDTSGAVTNNFERRDVGIVLKVTPQINSDGLVVLDVSQELSALSDQNIPVAEDVTTPIINKRTMTTRVGVESGQTVVIGGLVSDSLTETIRKVPLLGDIPVLGEFFKSRSKSKKKTELLVFLTPMVVQKPADLADLARQLRGEMQRMDLAVEPGLLQKHLDQLANLKVGDGLAPGAKP